MESPMFTKFVLALAVALTAGFVSKWQLGLGALESAHPWVVGVLLASSLFNALYFLPVVYRLWFRDPEDEERAAEPVSLLVPTLTTTAMVLVFGIGASVAFLPLDIAGAPIPRRRLRPTPSISSSTNPTTASRKISPSA